MARVATVLFHYFYRSGALVRLLAVLLDELVEHRVVLVRRGLTLRDYRRTAREYNVGHDLHKEQLQEQDLRAETTFTCI